jgi:hypothetical protein
MRAALSRERAQRANDAFLTAIITARTGTPAPGMDLTTPGLTARVGKLAQDQRPRAYTGPWPIPSHRTLAEVDAQNGGAA